MILVIYILLGVIVLVIVSVWIDTYNKAKYLKEQIEEHKLSDEDNIKLGTLQKFREMVFQNDSELKRKEINEYQHKENNKQIAKLIDEYEEKYGTKNVG